MIITWLGQACFKIQSKDKILIIDPYDEKIGFSLPKIDADIVLMTHSHYDHSNSAAFPSAKVVIQEHGEYALGDVTVKGIQTFHDDVGGQKRGLNTMYKIESEGITLLHMGDFGELEVRQETLTEIGIVDILMIPVGGTYTIDGAQAATCAKQIGAKIVIPMHYFIQGLKISLSNAEQFLQTMGVSNSAPQHFLKITKESLTGMDKSIILLSQVL